MHPRQVDEWLETSVKGMKRPRGDLFGEDGPCRNGFKRRRHDPGEHSTSIRLGRTKRSKSEADVQGLRDRPREEKNLLLSGTTCQDCLQQPQDMANIPSTAPSFSSGSMPPPPRPSASQFPSRSRSQSASRSTKGEATANPAYRTNVLERNDIFVQHLDIPPDITSAVRRILDPDDEEIIHAQIVLSYDEAERLARDFCREEDAKEANLLDLFSHHLFRRNDSRSSPVVKIDKAVFMSGALPFVPPPAFAIHIKPPKISNPVPDLTYGYISQAFNADQHWAQDELNEDAGCNLSQTASQLFWCFFMVEIKSQSTGGTIWAATNQCAGAGSTCTNAIHRMLKTVHTSGTGVRSDSISFSMAIDNLSAYLFAHWTDDAARKFYCGRVRHYALFEAQGILNIKRDIESVISWGLNTRLPMIKSALDTYIDRLQAEVSGATNFDA